MKGDDFNFNIRLAENNDIDEVEAIWIDGLKQLYKAIPNSEALELFKQNFSNRKNQFNFWVAEATSVIGWCSILPAFSHPLKQASNAEVSTYIEQQYNSNGIGTELMKFVFHQLENTQIENVYGFANPTNKQSIKMCENARMRICGETSTRIILIKEY